MRYNLTFASRLLIRTPATRIKPQVTYRETGSQVLYPFGRVISIDWEDSTSMWLKQKKKKEEEEEEERDNLKMRLPLPSSLIIKLAIAVEISKDVWQPDGKPVIWRHSASIAAPEGTESIQLLPEVKTQKSSTFQPPGRTRHRRDLNRSSGVIRQWPSSSIPLDDFEEDGDLPVEEVASLLSDVLVHHLDGCLKVILHKRSYFNQVVVEIIKSKTAEPIMTWDLDVFMDTEPSSVSLSTRAKKKKAITVYCVALVILADLQAVGQATLEIQRGNWFQGAEKRILAYAGSSLGLVQVAQHPTLGSGYHTVLVTVANAVIDQNKDEKAGRTYILLRACPYCRDGHPETSVIDTWTPKRGFSRQRDLFPDVFKNFNGHVFRIVTLEYAPFSCYEKTKGRDVRLKDCVDTRMINAVAGTLNFTYRVREPEDLQWGYKLDNGTYTGVIGAVQNYAADFSLNVAFTGDREKVIDYTVGYFNDPLTFCTTKPRQLNQALTLLRPFQLKVLLIL
ncbi:uncharacterized protein [Palaemon carinicauda]|uniref:uncharacterized protein n=1 Tax=Palaemon carinicauda TaxID=392227 RepID=UPI0035B5989E